MACLSPIGGWEAAKVNPTGKRSVVFRPQDGLVDRPVSIPCMKCSGCLADKALSLSIRGYHESMLHDRSCFLTLTYSDDNLPSDGKVDPEHLSLFLKRLRKQYGKLLYIACGEYGESTLRPHYHAIIFGHDFYTGEERICTSIDDQQYTNSNIEKIWGLGHITIAECSLSTIMYVCGYVYKKVGDTDCFQSLSRRPAVGKKWLEKYGENLARTGTVVMEGREYQIPPQYFTWAESLLAPVKKQRKQYAAEHPTYKKPWQSRDSRIINKSAKLSTRKRGKL